MVKLINPLNEWGLIMTHPKLLERLKSEFEGESIRRRKGRGMFLACNTLGVKGTC